jgi:hypothetical protein
LALSGIYLHNSERLYALDLTWHLRDMVQHGLSPFASIDTCFPSLEHVRSPRVRAVARVALVCSCVSNSDFVQDARDERKGVAGSSYDRLHPSLELGAGAVASADTMVVDAVINILLRAGS